MGGTDALYGFAEVAPGPDRGEVEAVHRAHSHLVSNRRDGVESASAGRARLGEGPPSNNFVGLLTFECGWLFAHVHHKLCGSDLTDRRFENQIACMIASPKFVDCCVVGFWLSSHWG